MSVTVTEWGAVLLLAAALVSDVRTMRIPNWLTLPAMAAGLLYHGLVEGWAGAGGALAGAAAGFLPLLLLYLFKGIGAGDVKLFTALGAWIGALLVLQSLMYAVLYAGAVGLLLAVLLRPFGRKLLSRMAHLFRGGRSLWFAALAGESSTVKSIKFPFMIAAVPGVLTAWFYSW